MSDSKSKAHLSMAPWRKRLHEIIFEADTFAGKAFDVTLLLLIILSVLLVMLESMQPVAADYGDWFYAAEWILTIAFSIEYMLRIFCVYQPRHYIKSFYGIIDLLAVLPTYLSLLLPGAQYLLVVRSMRLLRVFRIFKLVSFLKESQILVTALKASRIKITVFLSFVVMLVIIIGSVMYVIEAGQGSGFSNIPKSIYWAIVTLTTVGYGDIAPATALGQFFASCVMILGYAVIAVPTGIVSAELFKTKEGKQFNNTRSCQSCGREGHDTDADYCKYCGALL